MYPYFDKQFMVQTDDSLTAIGGALSQTNNQGEEHPVSYFSRMLNQAGRNYTYNWTQMFSSNLFLSAVQGIST